MFITPKSSKYTLIQRRPTPVHKVAYVTGGLGHLYRGIHNNNAVVPAKEGDFTDDEGAFAPQPGMPLLASRYKFLRLLGKGQSSILVKVQDVFQDGALRSVKVLHTHYSLLGVQESDCVRRINLADPFDTSGTLRLCNTFSYHGHYCMVFELLSPEPMTAYFKELDMHEVIPAIRKVSLRLLQAIGFLQQQNVIHADLKPSNILLKKEADLSTVKVVDFGNAIHCIHDELSLYYDDFELQTLLYRAPEVVYGLTFGLEVDIWSLGCVLAELYLNRPLFCGCDKEETLANMTDFLGPLPEEVFKRGKFFNDLSQFTSRSSDMTPVTTPELMDKLGCNDYSFVDFLRLLLLFNPHERMTVADAARHPFLAPEIGFGYVMSTSADQSYPSVLLDHQNYTKRPFIDEQRKRQRLSSAELLREGTSVIEPTASKVKVAHVMPIMKVTSDTADKSFINNNNNNSNNNNIGSYDLDVFDRGLQVPRMQEQRRVMQPREMSSNGYIRQDLVNTGLAVRTNGSRPKINTIHDSRTKVKHPTARYAFSPRRRSGDKMRTSNHIKVERIERTVIKAQGNLVMPVAKVESPVPVRAITNGSTNRQSGPYPRSNEPQSQIHSRSYEPQSSSDSTESDRMTDNENREAADLEGLHIRQLSSARGSSDIIPGVNSHRTTQPLSRTVYHDEYHEYKPVQHTKTDVLYPESSANGTFIVQSKVEAGIDLSPRHQEAVSSSLTSRKQAIGDKPAAKRQQRQAEGRALNERQTKEALRSAQGMPGARRQMVLSVDNSGSDTDPCQVTSTMDNPDMVRPGGQKPARVSTPNGTNAALLNSTFVKQHRPKSKQASPVMSARVSTPDHSRNKSSNVAASSIKQNSPKPQQPLVRVSKPDSGDGVVERSNLLPNSSPKPRQRSTAVPAKVATPDNSREASSKTTTGNSNSVKQNRQKTKQASASISTMNGSNTPVDNSKAVKQKRPKQKRPKPKAASVKVSTPNGSSTAIDNSNAVKQNWTKPMQISTRVSPHKQVFEKTYQKTVSQQLKPAGDESHANDFKREVPNTKSVFNVETTWGKASVGPKSSVKNGQNKVLKAKSKQESLRDMRTDGVYWGTEDLNNRQGTDSELDTDDGGGDDLPIDVPVCLADELNTTSTWSLLQAQNNQRVKGTRGVYTNRPNSLLDSDTYSVSSSDDEQRETLKRRIVPKQKPNVGQPRKTRESKLKITPVLKVKRKMSRKRTSTKQREMSNSDPDSAEETPTQNSAMKRLKMSPAGSQHEHVLITPQKHIRTGRQSGSSSKKKTPPHGRPRRAVSTKKTYNEDTSLDDTEEDEVMLL